MSLLSRGVCSHMLLVIDLPDVILKHLQTFLSYEDVIDFLNSNKVHFTSLRQETRYFSLNKKKSQEYVEDERFREMILSRVKDGNKQIELLFDEEYELPDIRDIVAHKIEFGRRRYPHLLNNVPSQYYFLPPEVQEIPFLPPILQDLELYDCMNIQDFSSLSHLKSLTLSVASQLTDITPLQNIPHLTFHNCKNIQNFSIISSKRQEFMSINHSAITDVSFLRNILTVELRSCDQLVDVSPLHGIKNLHLANCSSLEDISSLGNHHRLVIVDCISVRRGYECFRTVRHAETIGLEVSDLSVFQKVKSLAVEALRSMEIQLFYLEEIPELHLLPSSFFNRKEVYDVSHLRNIRLTFYDDFLTINDSGVSSQLLHLKLIGCEQIVKIIHEGKASSLFRHLQSLVIARCSIKHVNGLGDIPTVTLQFCSELHDISGLGRNKSVELRYCPNIRDVTSLSTIPSVTVTNCKGIVDYSCLSSVQHLKIVGGK